MRPLRKVRVSCVSVALVPIATDPELSSAAVHITLEAVHAFAKVIRQLEAELPVVINMTLSFPVTVGLPVPQEDTLGAGPPVMRCPTESSCSKIYVVYVEIEVCIEPTKAVNGELEAATIESIAIGVLVPIPI